MRDRSRHQQCARCRPRDTAFGASNGPAQGWAGRARNRGECGADRSAAAGLQTKWRCLDRPCRPLASRGVAALGCLARGRLRRDRTLLVDAGALVAQPGDAIESETALDRFRLTLAKERVGMLADKAGDVSHGDGARARPDSPCGQAAVVSTARTPLMVSATLQRSSWCDRACPFRCRCCGHHQFCLR
jgi:hypothetical protein